MTPSTLFGLGSVTKALTTMCLGILVDEGKLDWDTPVRSCLPDFKLLDPFATERITPRDLVVHVSGLPRHDMVWLNSDITQEEIIKRMAYLEPSYDFRSRYQYQNLTYVVAGFLIKQITGCSWNQFVRERILDVLEMKSSTLSVKESQQTADFALPYGLENGNIAETNFLVLDNVGPAGGLNSSALELANWITLHLGKGEYKGKRIISEAGMTAIHTPHVVAHGMPGLGVTIQHDELSYVNYGLGWLIQTFRGRNLIYHTGNSNGFSALVSFMPQEKLGMVVLCNQQLCDLPTVISLSLYERLLGIEQADWSSLIKQQIEQYMQEIETGQLTAPEKIADAPMSHPLQAYTGQYQNPGYGTLSVSVNNEQLVVTFNTVEYPLDHFHYDTFDMQGAKALFSANVSGAIDTISIPLEPSVKNIVFTRVSDPA